MKTDPKPKLVCLFITGILASATHAGPITYTYDAAGRLVVADYGGNTNLFHIYDAAGNLTESSAPGPLLSAAFSPGQVLFSWSAVAVDYTLRSATALTSPANFTPVPLAPALTGNRFTVTVNTPPVTGFFVLRR